jgi:hypothetical protein
VKIVVGSLSDGIYQALHAAGVFADDPKDVARVVIDLKVAEPAKVYIVRYLDDSIVDVILAGGVEIVEREAQ